MTKQTLKPAASGFHVPVDLLKGFMTEVRIRPGGGNPYGYILFDKEMLKEILLNEDKAARAGYAKRIDELSRQKIDLVMIAPVAVEQRQV